MEFSTSVAGRLPYEAPCAEQFDLTTGGGHDLLVIFSTLFSDEFVDDFTGSDLVDEPPL
ncbi:MAG: hypothetical protein HXM98_05660 [Porphyromonadaceae bacterium]|jgi:hypothetical protein|uniref:hypothetical protein n=1 Tax=uncultured Porphyromonas sp. TaxID=159274 RepID=UPI001CAFB266|nr:hypothetical protein [uncultured Porphyromonas sp.]MBF1274939.1 hypothetical protein [Porphyromonadaceae bacterium]MBF1289892.1 hypothetical protein [Porphyromonadaceae bacterium]MBF1363828.1 hypothetical protein [Porphyromonadaceae bacterium]MBS5870975.1 hypothetical protein [Porphyromonas sp.]